MSDLPTPEQLNAASLGELAELASACLEHFEPGRLPGPIFEQVSRLAVLASAEVFGIEASNPGKPSVLFAQRPAEDMWWAGQWHVPGSVLLADDRPEGVHDFSAPVKRVFETELGESIEQRGSLNLFDLQRRSGPRGSELTAFLWTEIDLVEGAQLSMDVRFLDAKDLSNSETEGSFIEGHVESARHALVAYEGRNGPSASPFLNLIS